MQVSIDQKEGLEKTISISLEAKEIQPKIDSKLNELGKEIRLKGFRKGRVPRNILDQRFGQHARQEVLGELMNNSLQEAIESNKLEIAAAPQVTKTDNLKDGGFSFEARVELMPQVPEIDFSDISASKMVAEVEDKDIDKMVKNLQKQKQDWKDSKGKIAKSDLVTIEYSAKGKGLKYPEDGEEKMGILLGESYIPEDLEKALIGLKVKEEGDAEVEFPETFSVKELAGKKAKMKFSITDVKKAKLPKVDEEFVKSFGVESGDVEEFRKDIRNNLERELKNSIEASLKNDLLSKLRDACKDMKLSDAMLNREAEAMIQQEAQRAQQMGVQEPQLPQVEDVQDAARERILNALILQNIAKKQDIKTDFTLVREKINEIAQTFEQPQEIVQMYYKSPELMATVEQSVVESQVMSWLESEVKIKEKKAKFEDLMQPK